MKPEPPIIPRQAEPPVMPASGKPQARTKLVDLIENRWLMLLMLFGVTAGLGLPLLWKSKSFSQNEKLVWSIVVSLYTVLIFWIFFKIMYWSYNNITESLRM